MRKALLPAFFLLLASFCAVAQDYCIELQPDKKVVYVRNLELPDNTPVLEILWMIPELVVREGDDFLNGYDIFLDSKSLGYNKEALLETLRRNEVEKIEISTSATASQQRNGMAGSIKIVSSSAPEGLSGNISGNLNTFWETHPNFNVNYRSDKLEVRGILGLQYISGNSSSYFERDIPPQKIAGENTVAEKYFQETARIHMKYTPTPKDQLKLWVLESYDLDNTNTLINGLCSERKPELGKDIYSITKDESTELLKCSTINLSAFAEYEHTFRENMKFNMQASYARTGKKKGPDMLDEFSSGKPQLIMSEAKFEFPFLPAGKRSLNMSLGGNADFNIDDSEVIESCYLYASPFVELKYKSPAWQINTGLRYQYYNMAYGKQKQELFNNGSKDITFNFNTLWQMADHHAIRFLVTKNIIRQSPDKMYPIMEFDQKRRAYVRGNKDLRPGEMFSFELGYISDWNLGPHYFIANLSLGYDRAEKLVTMVQRYDENLRMFYLTYDNTGVNDIISTKGNLIYNYGIFSLSLAGNWYHNIQNEVARTDHVDSFNIGLSPIFSFNKEWTLTGTFRYNSGIVSNDSKIGECLYSHMRISKTFGNWIVSAMLSDILGYTSENIEYKDGGYYYTMYDQYPRFFEVGVTYRIGRRN